MKKVLSAPRTRFAPSPTGELHVGAARAALFNWLHARSRGGFFVLRIEDTDSRRSRSSFERSIMHDLAWLGLDWDEGPDRPGAHGPYRQSERSELYGEAARTLLGRGLLYRCFCTPEELEAQRRAEREAGRTPRYSGRCRELGPEESSSRAAREPFALRFGAPGEPLSFKDRVKGTVEFTSDAWDDFVVLRTDGSAAYNFACVVDDAAMEITHVIRGEDLLPSTPKQLLLYAALEEEPPAFAHIPMVLGEDLAKLSKRHGAASLGSLRSEGHLPEALVNALALLGWSDSSGKEFLSIAELKKLFSLERVGRSNAVFDPLKLRYLNAQHLRAKAAPELLELVRPLLVREGVLDTSAGDAEMRWLEAALGAAVGSAEMPGDMLERLRPLWAFGNEPVAGELVRELGADAAAQRLLRRFAERAAEVDLGTPEAFRALAKELGGELEIKGRALFHPLRLGLTGVASGMALDKLVPLAATAPAGLRQPVASPAARVRRVLDALGEP